MMVLSCVSNVDEIESLSMNAAQQQAAESLAAELANRNVTIELTESQKALHISPHLVYLCGLVVIDPSTTSFTKEQIDFFQRLQSIYQKEANYYSLSATLIPCSDVQRIIQADLLKRQEELASQAAQKLIVEEEEAQKKLKKASSRRKKVLRSVNVVVETQESRNNEEQEKNEPRDETPLEDLLKPALLRTDDVDENEGGDWTRVIKKKTRDGPESWKADGTKVSSVVESKKQDESNKSDAEEEIVVEREMERPASLDRIWTEEDPALISVEASKSAKEDVPTTSAEEDVAETQTRNSPWVERAQEAVLMDTLAENEVSVLRDRVRQLELELASKDELLEQERVAHKRAFTAQQETYDERIQALQLRLYISETRLKTFEDALDQHVEAVANNVATSPTRRVLEERPLSSSRVLGNKQI